MEQEETQIYLYGKTFLSANNNFFIRNDSIVHMAAGDKHTLIVMESGRVYAFGLNTSGKRRVKNRTKIERSVIFNI